MAGCQATEMLNDPLSRAGSLLQGFVLYGLQRGSAPFVIPRLAIGMHTTVIADFSVGVYTTVIADFSIGMDTSVVPGLIMGAAATGGRYCARVA